jgi:hypothetical protein
MRVLREARKYDLRDLSYHGEFDGVLCVDPLESVLPEDWPVVLERWRRALRRGGWLFSTVELAPAIRCGRSKGHASSSVRGRASLT